MFNKLVKKATKSITNSVNTKINQPTGNVSDKRATNLPRIKETLRKNKEWKNDFVFLTTNDHCPICKNYNRKIFSINGKSKKYPPLPVEIIKNGGLCPNCSIGITSYFEGINGK